MPCLDWESRSFSKLLVSLSNLQGSLSEAMFSAGNARTSSN